MFKIIGLLISMVLILNSSVLIQNADAVTISITTDKEIYYYGDFLTFTVEVNEMTEQFATIRIIDQAGKSSSPINLPISELTTTITSPFPFESEVYGEGTYVIDIQYAGTQDSTEFDIKDSGKIVIPVWIKDVGKMWVNGLITDSDFTQGIEYLINNEIIIIPDTSSSDIEQESKVPLWVKTTTKWWTDGQISDNDFALGIQHLIRVGIIVIGN